MKHLSALLLLCLLPSLCDAQLLGGIFDRRGRRNVCPGGDCIQPSNPTPADHPTIMPEPGVTPAPAKSIDFVEVTPEDMPRNQSGQCTWCALMTVFCSAGYESTRHIVDTAVREGWHHGEVDNIIGALKAAGIEYKLTTSGDMSIFDHARAEGVGVLIHIRTNDPRVGHSVAVVGMDANSVRVVDNNGPKVIQTWTMDKFKRLWQGTACCPLKRKKPKPPTAPATPTPTDTTPAGPPKPVVDSGCKCDNSKIATALTTLTDAVTATNKSVGDLSSHVASIDQRLVVAEGKLSGVGQFPPPSVTTPDPAIKAVADELAKLKESLKQSGTLRVTVTPK